MGLKPGDKPIQYAVPPGVKKAIRRAAEELAENVPHDREMKPGPMTGYVMRWFLTLPRERQLEIVLAGAKIAGGSSDPAGSDPSAPGPRIKGLGGRVLPKRKRKDSATAADDRPSAVRTLV